MTAVVHMESKNKGFFFRLHGAGGKSILAVCDTGLQGKTIKHNGIDFEVSSSFYGESRTSAEDILGKVREAGIVNVVGKGIVDLLVKNNLVDEECILWLGDTPHVQIVRI
jgi:hypothetical protein